jgi:hypothetical protein
MYYGIYNVYLQDSGPLTEDMLEAMQVVDGHAQLFSDMQAFKAANPTTHRLDDFVRWHSPRDWTPEFGLSERMAQPQGVWSRLWAQARPVPVTRQPRLFNESKCAEQVSVACAWSFAEH